MPGPWGLDVPRFQQCLDSGRYEEAIREDIEAGLRAGGRGNDSPVKVRRGIPGALDYVGFTRLLASPLPHEN